MCEPELMNNYYCGKNMRVIKGESETRWIYIYPSMHRVDGRWINEVRQRLIRIHFPHKCVCRGRNLFFQTLSFSLFSLTTTMITLTVFRRRPPSRISSAIKDFVISSNFLSSSPLSISISSSSHPLHRSSSSS